MVLSDTPETGHSAVGMHVAFCNIEGADTETIVAACRILVGAQVQRVLDQVEEQVAMRREAGGDGNTVENTTTKLDA
jgi:hypothetical protein